MILESQLLAKLSEGCVIKLAFIVWDEHSRDSKTVDIVLPDEASNVLLNDLWQWLCFHPFSEIINPYHQELHLPCSHGKGTKDVQSLLSKWPRVHHQGEILWWLPRYVTVALTLFTCLDISFSIYLHGRLVISCTNYLIDEGLGPWMVSTGFFMDISQDIKGLIWI